MTSASTRPTCRHWHHCAWEEAPEQYAAITTRWLNGDFRKA
jgi:hypothetical protein